MGTPSTAVSSGHETPRVFIAHEKLSRGMLLYRQLRSQGLHVVAPQLRADTSPLRQLHEYAPDVVVLAVTSSRAPWDAVTLARTLRAEPRRPGILFLTGGPYRATDLSLADDYALDGCSAAELALRVEVLLTRRSSSTPPPPQAPPPGLHILPASRRVLLHGHEVALTATEFDILQVLAERVGQVVPKGEILDRVWHHDFNGESNIVEAYICNLRRKLADPQRTLIATVRGIGYRLACDEWQLTADSATLPKVPAGIS